jgi:hypothetical protein
VEHFGDKFGENNWWRIFGENIWWRIFGGD